MFMHLAKHRFTHALQFIHFFWLIYLNLLISFIKKINSSRTHVNTNLTTNTLFTIYEKYKDGESLREHLDQVPKTHAKLMPLLEPGQELKKCYEIL